MPKYDTYNAEEATPQLENNTEDASIQKGEASSVKEEPIKELTREEKKLLAEEKAAAENFESLSEEFMKLWYDRSERHPGILYDLSRTNAMIGFELYHTDRKKFIKWRHEHFKPKIIAPFPINLPPGCIEFKSYEMKKPPGEGRSPQPKLKRLHSRDRYSLC